MTQSYQKLEAIEVAFDDENLVANAGLLLVSTLASKLGLADVIADKVDLGVPHQTRHTTLFSPDELAHTTDACNACAILCTSEESGANYSESHNDPTVQVKRLSKRIEALGFEVAVTERVA